MFRKFFNKLKRNANANPTTAKVIFAVLIMLFVLAVFYGIDVLIAAVLVKLLSLLFGFTFTWKIAFISAAILAILQMLFGKSNKSEN